MTPHTQVKESPTPPPSELARNVSSGANLTAAQRNDAMRFAFDQLDAADTACAAGDTRTAWEHSRNARKAIQLLGLC